MRRALVSWGVVLGVALAAPASAQAPGGPDAGTPSPLDAPLASRAAPPPPAAPRAKTAFWLPVVEIASMNLALTTFNYLVFDEDWARPTLATTLDNLASPWVLDDDEFNVNTVGHPYQGSFAFLAARSAGFGFLGSMAAAGASSVLWEVAGESETPSANDLVNTTFGGAFLGEALYRAALAAERSHLGPRWLRWLGVVLFDPLGSVNRALLGARYGEAELPEVPLMARFSLGFNPLGGVRTFREVDLGVVSLGPELHLAAQLRSGFPASRSFAPSQPFDHFDLRGEVSISRQPWAALFVSGLLAGQRWSLGPRALGVWGLFGGYDFANPAVLRVSTVSSGLGATVAVDLAQRTQLQLAVIVSGFALGSAGSLPVLEPNERDHHLGPGGQAFAELALVHRRWGAARVTWREYLVGPGFGQDGLESVMYLDANAAFALSPHLELWASMVVSGRHAWYGGSNRPTVNQTAHQLRVGLTWRSSLGHGFADE